MAKHRPFKQDKGWDGEPLWIPNIKLSEGKNFYKVDR